MSASPGNVDWVDTVANELFAPLTRDQQLAVNLTAEAFFQSGRRWPTFQFVEQHLEQAGLDAKAVLGSFPVAGTAVRYAAFRSSPTAGSLTDDQPVDLTVLGLHHYKGPLFLEAQALIKDALLLVQVFVDARRNFMPPPTEVKQLQVTSDEVLAAVNQARRSPFQLPTPAVLAGLHKTEPPLYASMGGSSTETMVIWTIWRSLRDFDGVTDVDDYVRRIVAKYHTPRAPQQPVLAAPLSLPSSLGYLDTAWRVMAGRDVHLIVLPSPERAASLAFDAGTSGEYLERLGALADVLKWIQVPPGGNQQGGHPLRKLRAYLEWKLPKESHSRVSDALDQLKYVNNIRNGGLHAEAEPLALQGYKALGIAYPITDPRAAWDAIRTATVQALDALRDEIMSYVDSVGAAVPAKKSGLAKKSKPRPSSTTLPRK